MNSGLYTAFSGLRSQMNALETVANNLSNLNTAGFKEQRTFYSLFNGTLEATDEKKFNAVVNNHAVLAGDVLNMAAGSLLQTGRDLDVSLEGSGFLAVQTPQGERYTRNGNLELDGDGALRTSEGFAVLGNGGSITLGSGRIEIDSAGSISVEGNPVDRLKIVTFDNPLTLRKEGHSLFSASPSSGSASASSETRVRQGSLEQSNVNPVLATVQMIGIMRQFESIQKGINLLMNDINSKSIERLSE